MGLKSLVAKLAPDTQLIIVTVGLADVKDSENIKNIRKSIQTQITEELFRKAQIFHLRGAINYEKLNFKHKTMMAMLYAKGKKDSGGKEKRRNESIGGHLWEKGKLC